MKEIVEAIASSIETEVPEAATWTVEKHDPSWRNPEKGSVLSIYQVRERAGDPWVNGYREIIHEIACEYFEASNDQPLQRDEDAELELTETARSIKRWAFGHLGGFAPHCHKLEWTMTDNQPELRREVLVRYFVVRLLAYRNEAFT